MKLKTVYICQNCQFQSSKWQGKCPECESWNTLMEDVINVGKKDSTKNISRPRLASQSPSRISEHKKIVLRTPTGMQELDQVLGGGIVEGSLILLSGEPGIGKSTLTLQILDRMAEQKESVLYVTGEESVEQVVDRAHRLGTVRENMELVYENQLETILALIASKKPSFLVIDSIQVMVSENLEAMAGSLTQVRAVTEAIMQAIKQAKIPTLLIGHVNKDGNIAGPKVLEHLVDTVLVLEGQRDHEMRLLRVLKNRFGPVNEVGLFKLSSKGMEEIANPAEELLKNRPEKSFGTCLTLVMEGNRPLLMEVQALAEKTAFGYPKRSTQGFDRNRLELLLAVLQKHAGLSFADQDVYVNVVGGLHLQDPAADLAVAAALASSLLSKAVKKDLVAFGEMSLTGEIRPAFRNEEREKAVKKLGLKSLNAGPSLRATLFALTK